LKIQLFFLKCEIGVREGDHFKKAFEYARKEMMKIVRHTSAQLDDNGDQVASAGDGLLASNTYLEGLMTWGLEPVIHEIFVTKVLEGATFTPISVQVIQGDQPVERVWAQIIKPDTDTTGETAVVFPEVDLNYNNDTGNYEGVLTGLTQTGLYTIVVLAEDVVKEVSDPNTAHISVFVKPGDVNGDDKVDLADAILALKVLCGVNAGDETVNLGADVNGDGKIGLAEAMYVLQVLAELRD